MSFEFREIPVKIVVSRRVHDLRKSVTVQPGKKPNLNLKCFFYSYIASYLQCRSHEDRKIFDFFTTFYGLKMLIRFVRITTRLGAGSLRVQSSVPMNWTGKKRRNCLTSDTRNAIEENGKCASLCALTYVRAPGTILAR